MAGGGERAAWTRTPGSRGRARERAAEQAVGARVEAGVAGLAHLLQVGGGEGGLTVGAAAADVGLESSDARVGVRLGADLGAVADSAHAGRARRRPLVVPRRREYGERSGEREDDGEQRTAAGSHAGQTPGGCGTGACAGSVRFTMPVMPSVGVAT